MVSRSWLVGVLVVVVGCVGSEGGGFPDLFGDDPDASVGGTGTGGPDDQASDGDNEPKPPKPIGNGGADAAVDASSTGGGDVDAGLDASTPALDAGDDGGADASATGTGNGNGSGNTGSGNGGTGADASNTGSGNGASDAGGSGNGTGTGTGTGSDDAGVSSGTNSGAGNGSTSNTGADASTTGSGSGSTSNTGADASTTGSGNGGSSGGSGGEPDAGLAPCDDGGVRDVCGVCGGDNSSCGAHPLAGRYAARTVLYARQAADVAGSLLDVVSKGSLISVVDIDAQGNATESYCFLETIANEGLYSYTYPSSSQRMTPSVTLLSTSNGHYVRALADDESFVGYDPTLQPLDCVPGSTHSSGCKCFPDDEIPSDPLDCRVVDLEADGQPGGAVQVDLARVLDPEGTPGFVTLHVAIRKAV